MLPLSKGGGAQEHHSYRATLGPPVVSLEGYGDSCLLIHATHKHLNQLRFPVLDLVCGGVERQLVVGAPLDAFSVATSSIGVGVKLVAWAIAS